MYVYWFVLFPQLFGIKDESFAPRLSFLLVGLWWMGFAQITFKHLPKNYALPQNKNKNILTNGFEELSKVWKQIIQMPLLKRYLFAFFF